MGRGQYPSQYSFDGLVDEVGIFNTALTDAQIEQSTAAYDMTEQRRTKPDMIRRVLPAGDKNWNEFGARYTHLPFHESWNKMFRVCGHPDIVVSFDKMPCRFVLWHGVGYIPMLVSENGRWYSNEFNENWWKGCCEPMSDKKMVFGRVHILEQSPARVVLKWRYPLSTVGYEISYEDPETGWGNWSTWYMTIYPGRFDRQADADLHVRKPASRVAGVDGDHGARATARGGHRHHARADRRHARRHDPAVLVDRLASRRRSTIPTRFSTS